MKTTSLPPSNRGRSRGQGVSGAGSSRGFVPRHVGAVLGPHTSSLCGPAPSSLHLRTPSDWNRATLLTSFNLVISLMTLLPTQPPSEALRLALQRRTWPGTVQPGTPGKPPLSLPTLISLGLELWVGRASAKRASFCLPLEPSGHRCMKTALSPRHVFLGPAGPLLGFLFP